MGGNAAALTAQIAPSTCGRCRCNSVLVAPLFLLLPTLLPPPRMLLLPVLLLLPLLPCPALPCPALQKVLLPPLVAFTAR